MKAIPMLLTCPMCHKRHIDQGEWATDAKAHGVHECAFCGLQWRPALVNTVGVERLSDYKDDNKDEVPSVEEYRDATVFVLEKYGFPSAMAIKDLPLFVEQTIIDADAGKRK